MSLTSCFLAARNTRPLAQGVGARFGEIPASAHRPAPRVSGRSRAPASHQPALSPSGVQTGRPLGPAVRSAHRDHAAATNEGKLAT